MKARRDRHKNGRSRPRAVWVRLNAEMLKRINEMEAARTVADFRDE
jgi:hypothetical protein